MEPNQAPFYVGTSGWSYKHWSGVFYPPEVKPARYLEFYMIRFRAVELNSSFYHLPLPRTVENWFKRSPEDFRFCPKLSRFITHRKKLKEVAEPLMRFFEVFEPLKPRMGPVLIQLPPSFVFDPDVLGGFFAILTKNYRMYQFALEARHQSWDSEEVARFLGGYRVALVIADSGGRFPTLRYQTAPFFYYRFHGPGTLYASDYSEVQLREYAATIREQLNTGFPVWAFFNNDVGGYAVKNALTLRKMVAGE